MIEKWVERHLRALVGGKPLARFELWGRIGSDPSEKIETFTFGDEKSHKPEEVAAELEEAADSWHKGHGAGKRARFSVMAYFGKRTTWDAQTGFVREGDEAAAVRTGEGALMRHLEAREKNLLVMVDKVNEENESLRARNRDLEAENLAWALRFKNLVTEEDDRRVARQKEEQKAEMMRGLLPMAMSLMAGARGQGPTDPHVLALVAFVKDLDEEEFNGITNALKGQHKLFWLEFYKRTEELDKKLQAGGGLRSLPGGKS